MMALQSHMAARGSLSRPAFFAPRQPPMRGAFFASGLGPALFVSKRGNKGARLPRSTRRVPHQRDPQSRRRNDAMSWSTPEVREVCVGMEVTAYLSRGDVI